MQKQRTWKDYLVVALILIAPFVLYKGMMWAITTETLNPIWFTLILVYIVLVYPQVMGLNALRDLNWILDEEYDGKPAIRSKKDWFVFLNDMNLKDFFVDGPAWKTVVYYLMNISSFVMVISILYVNFLVVFLDFGATFALTAVYVMFGSTIIYILMKGIVVGNLVNYYSSPLMAITGLVFPLGFYVLHLAIKSYGYQMDTILASNALGDED